MHHVASLATHISGMFKLIFFKFILNRTKELICCQLSDDFLMFTKIHKLILWCANVQLQSTVAFYSLVIIIDQNCYAEIFKGLSYRIHTYNFEVCKFCGWHKHQNFKYFNLSLYDSRHYNGYKQHYIKIFKLNILNCCIPPL